LNFERVNKIYISPDGQQQCKLCSRLTIGVAAELALLRGKLPKESPAVAGIALVHEPPHQGQLLLLWAGQQHGRGGAHGLAEWRVEWTVDHLLGLGDGEGRDDLHERKRRV